MTDTVTREMLLTRSYIEEITGAALVNYGAAPHAITDMLVQSIPGAQFAYGTRRGRRTPWASIGDPYGPFSLVVDWHSWYWDAPGQGPMGYVESLAFSPYIPDGCKRPSVDWLQAIVSGGTRTLEVKGEGLSDEARDWCERAGERPVAWWMLVWEDGLLGWPSREIMKAFVEQHPTHKALVPVFIREMFLH